MLLCIFYLFFWRKPNPVFDLFMANEFEFGNWSEFRRFMYGIYGRVLIFTLSFCFWSSWVCSFYIQVFIIMCIVDDGFILQTPEGTNGSHGMSLFLLYLILFNFILFFKFRGPYLLNPFFPLHLLMAPDTSLESIRIQCVVFLRSNRKLMIIFKIIFFFLAGG